MEATIQSVLEQDYPNLEYIIIDGGSTDRSVEIIKKYQSQLAYWISEPDDGLYYAIQKGFDKSTGDVMAWINSDDMYHNKSLFIIAEIFNNYQDVNWLTGAGSNFDEFGRTVNVTKHQRIWKYNFYGSGIPWIQQESTFWRKALWEKIGAKLRLEYKYAADFALWVDIMSVDKLFFVDALLGGFRLRVKGQISVDNYYNYIGEVKKAKKNLLVTSEEKKLYSIYQKLLSINHWLSKLKILSFQFFLDKFKIRYFAFNNEFEFDRITQKFNLKKQK